MTRHVPAGDGEPRVPAARARLRNAGWRYAMTGIVAVVVGQSVATRRSTAATSLWTILVACAVVCLVGAIRSFRGADRLRRDQPDRP